MGQSGSGLRARLYRQLEPRAWGRKGLSPTNHAIAWLILFAALVGILQTEPELEGRFGLAFLVTEVTLGCLFLLEYLARLWTVAEEPGGGPAWRCRLRFIVSPWSVLHLCFNGVRQIHRRDHQTMCHT